MKLIYLGKITSTHGIKGELKIHSNFEYKIQAFRVGNHLTINNVDYTIKSYRRHKDFDMVTLNDYKDINEVQFLLKQKVYIKEEELNLENDEVLDEDLLNYKVIINNDIGFDIISKLPMENVKVVYQGIDGAYSQQAAMSYFGDNATYHNVLTFKQAMKEVRDGVADYAVLPFENSTAGIVTDVYDLLVEFENYIVDSFDVKISHCLSAVKGTTLETIKEVYSHPQALMQSSKFIDEYGWNKVNCANTAIAAQIISQEKDNTRACIASRNAAKLYGLEVLAEDVNQSSINTTKFIIVSRRKIARREANNICISFEMPHESGSLYTMLSHIIYNDLNMTRIESRPVPGKKWEYRFYVEFEGKSDQPGVVNALSGINAEALNMQILGNY